MPKLSKSAIGEFCKTAKIVFPRDKIFNPMDYYDVFMSSRESNHKAGITKTTYRRYVNDLYISGSFCGLERVRNNTQSPYMFFVDSTLSGPDTLPSVALRKSPPNTYLNKFSSQLLTLLAPNVKYKSKTLYSKYRREFSSRIKFSTFKKYISSVFIGGFLPPLSRRNTSSGFVYWVSESKISPVNYTQAREEVAAQKKADQLKLLEKIDLSAFGLECVSEQECSSCGKGNPTSARFCMHCGTPLSVLSRVVVQEDVRELRFPRSYSAEKIQEFVSSYLTDRLKVSVVEENGSFVVVVFFDKE